MTVSNRWSKPAMAGGTAVTFVPSRPTTATCPNDERLLTAHAPVDGSSVSNRLSKGPRTVTRVVEVPLRSSTRYVTEYASGTRDTDTGGPSTTSDPDGASLSR